MNKFIMSKPFYILAVAPMQPSTINKFFEPGEGSVTELLKHPEKLRNMGWDLRTLDTPRIVKGEYLQVRNGERKLINLYEDGTLIFRALADHTFLGHGQGEEGFKENPRLNPMAVIEVTYNFVDFYKKLVFYFSSKPIDVKFKVEFKNAFFGGKKIYLNPYGLKSLEWRDDYDQHLASEENMSKEIIVKVEDLLNSPAHVAYELVQKLYLWFGFDPNKIPYTSKDEEGKRFIDVKKIIKNE